MDKFMSLCEQIWSMKLVQFVVYLLIAFVAAFIAKAVVTGFLKLLKLDKKLGKENGEPLAFVGKLVYLIVFLMFLPTALNAIGINSLSSPINEFTSVFVEYLPKIVASGIVFYVGAFVAKLLSQVVSTLLKKTRIDNLMKRKEGEVKQFLISDVLGKTVAGVVYLVAFVQALLVLEIDAISGPTTQIVNAVFDVIPSVALAIIVMGCGIFAMNILCPLLSNILSMLHLDELVQKIVPQIKFSATKVVVNVVRVLITLFVVAQGIEVLNLSVFNTIIASILSYVPAIAKAVLVALVAFVGASLLESGLKKAGAKAPAALIAKVAIYTVAAFMILSQLGIATVIVETAFVVVLVAVALAFALAFGLGGKEFAKKTLDRVDEKIEKNKEEKSE